MEWLNKYGKPIYVIWSVISVILIMFYIIVNFCFEKPLTSGYEYFDGVKIEGDNLEISDEIPIIELNIVRSDTNPELNLTEMVITEYTDYEQNSHKRYGMQVLGNVYYYCPANMSFNVDSPDYRAGSYVNGYYPLSGKSVRTKPYYYEIDVDGDIVNSEFNYIDKEVDELDVTAGETAFKLEIGGSDAKYSYTNTYYSRTGWNDWNKLFNNTKTGTYTNEYNIIDLFGYLAKSFETGESDLVKSFDNLDLDKYFTITKDNGKGQFYSLKDVTTNHAYFRVKCTYRKITSHLNASEHSIIGSIASDVNFNSGVVNTSTPYYSTGVDLTLNASQFTLGTHDSVAGSVLKLDGSFVKYLSSLNNLNLYIDIDLDIFNENSIAGLDITSLSNLKVSTFFVHSTSGQDFYVIGSLKNMGGFATSGLNTFYINGGV